MVFFSDPELVAINQSHSCTCRYTKVRQLILLIQSIRYKTALMLQRGLLLYKTQIKPRVKQVSIVIYNSFVNLIPRHTRLKSYLRPKRKTSFRKVILRKPDLIVAYEGLLNTLKDFLCKRLFYEYRIIINQVIERIHFPSLIKDDISCCDQRHSNCMLINR